jgi:hypothetical protein
MMELGDFSVRRLCVILGWGLLALAALFVALALMPGLGDWSVVAICLGIAGASLIGGLLLIWLARKVPAPAVPSAAAAGDFPNIGDDPIGKQLQKLRRAFWLFLVLLPVVSVWIAYDLYRLETGAVKSVRVWWGIALLYNCLGFWPAVLFLPAITVLGLIGCSARIRKLQSEDELNKALAGPRSSCDQ